MLYILEGFSDCLWRKEMIIMWPYEVCFYLITLHITCKSITRLPCFCRMNALISVGQGGFAILTGYLADKYGYLVLQVFFMASVCGELDIRTVASRRDQTCLREFRQSKPQVSLLSYRL